MLLNIKKLEPNAVLPKRAHSSDAGLDLTATSLKLQNNQAIYGIGLAIEIPKGHVGLIYPRSSIYKKDLILSNSTGVIDVEFLGEVKAIFNLTKENTTNIYNIGDRICQLVICPIITPDPVEVDSFEPSERGTLGFGSSGV